MGLNPKIFCSNLFTIQNVPIKLKYPCNTGFCVGDLQYKMFLLNGKCYVNDDVLNNIYNTKCSY